MTVPAVAILDDDPRRAEAFEKALRAISAGREIRLVDNAPDFIAWLSENLGRTILICLDHDLGPSRLRDGARFEPGTGRDVVDWLATRQPTCPVIVHSSNSLAVSGMLFALEQAGWTTSRVLPMGDLEWIQAAWVAAVACTLRT